MASLLATSIASRADPRSRSILTHHGQLDRSGNFIVPALTWERAKSLRLDEDFRPRVAGNVYAQPLYWRAPGSKSAIILLATEDNVVYAIDADTGAEVWKSSLGRPVARASLPCGNIDTLGITGAPVIDEATEAIYLDAAIEAPAGVRHRVFALSLKDGSVLPGWPVDVADALRGAGKDFAPLVQNQRGALTLLDGMVYVPFGGHTGD